METVQVNALSRTYSIRLFMDPFEEIVADFAKKHLSFLKVEKKYVLTDKNVYRIYGSAINDFVKAVQGYLHVIPAGEKQKSQKRAHAIYTDLLEKGFHRNSLMIALGGGVIGDLAGFVASTYLRGISYIQIPTTLLAQVDSSVGGKVAINHPLSKNSIGTFYQPWGVYTFLPFLRTLSNREYRSGLAEVIKYGVIRDRKFFSFLSEHTREINGRSLDVLCRIVRRSCEIKAEIVRKDEKEANLRAILNFGHTLGHALEIAGSFRWRHGQGVAMGSLFAAYLAEKLGIAREDVYSELRGLFSRLHLPVNAAYFPEEELLSIMLKDKKNVGNTITFILPEQIGKVKIVKGLEAQDVLSVLKQYYKELS